MSNANPTQPSSPPAHLPSALKASAKDSITRNRQLCAKFYAPPSRDTPPTPAHIRAAALRKAVTLNFSPYTPRKRPRTGTSGAVVLAGSRTQPVETGEPSTRANGAQHNALVVATAAGGPGGNAMPASAGAHGGALSTTHADLLTMRRRQIRLQQERPTWHPPWRVYRVMSGHLGWVRSVAFDASNEWFATGSADRTIKVWDTASGRLKLTLTGHVASVRAIAISERHPYLFSVGEDKSVKCWDLEQNKVIRNYHGHLSGVYCAALHPTLDVLLTGGRDSTVRVWDVRTRVQAHVLGGHHDTVNAVLAQAVEPQIVSASVDSTVRLWDLVAGRCRATLTNHKKGVRALAAHPREFSFASASADSIKTWGFPDGVFMRNLGGGHGGKLVNALAVNEDGVLVSGGDDGSVGFWDYAAAHRFDKRKSTVQPGSLDCEAGIYAMSFDKSGIRLVTAEADKTVRMWREDETATETTHPLRWTPGMHAQQ